MAAATRICLNPRAGRSTPPRTFTFRPLAADPDAGKPSRPMSTLATRIEKDFITAYKAREEVRVGVLRMVKTALKNRQVELGRELDDGEVLDVLVRQLKQRQESIDQFRAAGRDEMARREADEAEIIKAYMPAPLTSEETTALVEATIAELGASGMADMGRVMGAITASHKGRVDNKAVSRMVRQRLSS